MKKKRIDEEKVKEVMSIDTQGVLLLIPCIIYMMYVLFTLACGVKDVLNLHIY